MNFKQKELLLICIICLTMCVRTEDQCCEKFTFTCNQKNPPRCKCNIEDCKSDCNKECELDLSDCECKEVKEIIHETEASFSMTSCNDFLPKVISAYSETECSRKQFKLTCQKPSRSDPKTWICALNSTLNNITSTTSLSGLGIGLIVAAVIIAAVTTISLVIWKLRYKCILPALLTRRDTKSSSTSELTSIENPREQDGTVYEQIPEQPYNELEPSETNGPKNMRISCASDSTVISNSSLDNNNLENGGSVQPYSHLHEHSRGITHDYNMSQLTELSDSSSGMNHSVNSNRSTPNYNLAKVMNEIIKPTDAGSNHTGLSDNEVSLPNITEEDNLESDYDVPPVRKDEEKNPYFELENDPVTGQVTEDDLDTDYDVPPARKSDRNIYFELQNETETDQPTEDNGETFREMEPDRKYSSNNPYFQLENRTGEDEVNQMDDHSDKYSTEGDHHSVGDDNLLGDYDVPPPRREKP